MPSLKDVIDRITLLSNAQVTLKHALLNEGLKDEYS